MGIREEIASLIEKERARLHVEDDKLADFHSEQRALFATIQHALREIAESLEARGVRFAEDHESATFGWPQDGAQTMSAMRYGVTWRIVANSDGRHHRGEATGWKVTETVRRESVEFEHMSDYESEFGSSTDRTFTTADEAISFIASKLAGKVAEAEQRREGGAEAARRRLGLPPR